MEAYTGFAEVYDTFMDNIPYEEWAEYVISLLHEYNIVPGLEKTTIVDLGCGTGTLTEILCKYGYEMVGIDLSEDMLMIAKDKSLKSKSNILYSLQDMCEFAVPNQVNAIISICDSMNYLIEENDLISVFNCVKNSLDKNGIFIFDMKTIHFFKDVLGDSTIAENRENSAFIWDNYYYEEEAVNEYELTIFVEESNNLYRKYEEIHFQRGYTIEEVCNAIHRTGLKIYHIYDAFTHNNPTEESERLYYIIGN